MANVSKKKKRQKVSFKDQEDFSSTEQRTGYLSSEDIALQRDGSSYYTKWTVFIALAVPKSEFVAQSI